MVQIAVVRVAEMGQHSHCRRDLRSVREGPWENLRRRATERTQALYRPNEPDETSEAERIQYFFLISISYAFWRDKVFAAPRSGIRPSPVRHGGGSPPLPCGRIMACHG
jgi:hypothetical protein